MLILRFMLVNTINSFVGFRALYKKCVNSSTIQTSTFFYVYKVSVYNYITAERRLHMQFQARI